MCIVNTILDLRHHIRYYSILAVLILLKCYCQFNMSIPKSSTNADNDFKILKLVQVSGLFLDLMHMARTKH